MRLSWFGDFFGAIPDALRALYEFGDPSGVGNGWWGIVIALIWGVGLCAIPLAIAYRTYGERDWISATMGALGGFTILWWLFGILPSAWLYYADANKEILQDRVIPTSLTLTINGVYFPIATNLYDVIRDTVVVVQHLIALAVVFWAAFAVQKRFPKQLAPGEERAESTGGYK